MVFTDAAINKNDEERQLHLITAFQNRNPNPQDTAHTAEG